MILKSVSLFERYLQNNFSADSVAAFKEFGDYPAAWSKDYIWEKALADLLHTASEAGMNIGLRLKKLGTPMLETPSGKRWMPVTCI